MKSGVMRGWGRSLRLLLVGISLLGTLAVCAVSALAGGDFGRHLKAPIVLEDQGSFLVGGGVVTNPGAFDPIALTPDGQTIHGDHAYVQYQIPLHARRLPLVFWHGGNQFSKTWETTPDGRDGFQNIFLRRGFSTFILDQPHRGRAGRSTVNADTPTNFVPGPGPLGEQAIFIRFRLGIWPEYFPGVQFSQSPEALEQWWRQQTLDTAPTTDALTSDAAAALFQKVGPAILVTHSAGGLPGWLTAPKARNVRAIVSYEPVACVFPEGEVPPPIPTSGGDVPGTAIPAAAFAQLARIPIQIIYGDNIPDSQSPYGLDLWRGRRAMCRLSVERLRAAGGDAELLNLPEVGVHGNTHFAMSDLNNEEIADLLSQYLHAKKLDAFPTH
jgi:hypothetical protein